MSVDPKSVFLSAEVFRHGSQVLAAGLPNTMAPMVVCTAFSMELYLKCLITIEGGDHKNEHNLERLFRKTSAGSQDAIRKNYEKKRAIQDAQFAAAKVPARPKSDFDHVLLASADAFVDFRYIYEGGIGQGEGWLAGPISECVRDRIIELHPEWANLFR
jgi:hypothetical protein